MSPEQAPPEHAPPTQPEQGSLGHGSSEQAPIRRASKGKVLGVLAVVGIAAVATAVVGVDDRAKSMQEVGAWTDGQAAPTVQVVRATRGPSEEDLSLPGTVSAYTTGSLYARASGYVTSWSKDIGARVHKGDVLAEISAPDLDQQLAEAKAQFVQLQAAVEQAQANADLGTANNQRTSRLVAQGWSSQANGDTDRFTAASRMAALAVAKANIIAQQAVVNRLNELAGFKQIKAPFDGVVTARSVDVGDLVNAGGTTGRALFQVADLHRMRVYVNVPQAFFGEMKEGLKATLALPGRDETFAAELVSTSNAVAEGSRTALVELQTDNPSGRLWPGAFTEVRFHIASDPTTLRVPATTLVFGKRGMFVAAVEASGRDGEGKVALHPIVLGRNLGQEVEIRSGVSLGDRLIDNPQETINAGDTVRVAGEGGAKGPGGAKATEVSARE